MRNYQRCLNLTSLTLLFKSSESDAPTQKGRHLRGITPITQ